MKKLFFFRPPASTNRKSDSASSPPPNNEVYWENPPESASESEAYEQDSEYSQCPKDVFSTPGERYAESPVSAGEGHRRSLSYSSPTYYANIKELDTNSLSDHSEPQSTNKSVLYQKADHGVRCRSLTPERLPKPESHAIQLEKSPGLSRGFFDSSINSPCSSPVSIRCRAAHLPQVSNEFHDLYIDGEQQERKFRPGSDIGRHSSGSRKNPSFKEASEMAGFKRPPRVQSSVPASPTKEQLRSNSFHEFIDPHTCNSMKGWAKDNLRPLSRQKHLRYAQEKMPRMFPRALTEPQDFDSETTTTIEDIYEDCSEPHPRITSNSIPKRGSLPDNICHAHISYDETENGYLSKEMPGFLKESNFFGEAPVSSKHEENIDAELDRKWKEAEERVLLLEEEFEQLTVWDHGFSIPALLQTIENTTQDRRNLALELSLQIQSRISDRAMASEALKRAKLDIDVRTRRLLREKSELQASLEKELDRRSSEWSVRLRKYQSEEQRLRDRVRELAEQNVSLQREVSSFHSREEGFHSRLENLELQLKEKSEMLQEARGENHNLRQELSELQERCRGAETERDCIRSSYKEKENESNELQKAVVRLQRICNENDKTINGLRQVLSDEIQKEPLQKGDVKSRLQMELERLTGVEMILRKEVESYQLEVESLRHENFNLLERLRGAQNGGALSLIKLDQELGARVDCLQNQCLSMLNENGELCSKLLEFVKGIHAIACAEEVQEASRGFRGHSLMEYDMKFESLKRATENLGKSLRTISVVLQEKSKLDASVSVSGNLDDGVAKHLKGQLFEGNLELELKAEILLTRVLREKLCFKELEIERLQADLSASVRGLDNLRFENQRSQDSISSLTHKMKDLELQLLRKDENINQSQSDLQECLKELTVLRGILPKVTQERDLMWEEVKQYSEKNMLLNREVISLKKRIEALEEGILVKEGQITILKDSIDCKPFDILSSSKSFKEFTLE